mmetsp:Transcript_37696/g.82596  ORF Transcript_37696/g.82596 Transcript_37696/m.82596 type:complete len:202 (-) Transcript_37696:961-1566(-)
MRRISQAQCQPTYASTTSLQGASRTIYRPIAMLPVPLPIVAAARATHVRPLRLHLHQQRHQLPHHRRPPLLHRRLCPSLLGTILGLLGLRRQPLSPILLQPSVNQIPQRADLVVRRLHLHLHKDVKLLLHQPDLHLLVHVPRLVHRPEPALLLRNPRGHSPRLQHHRVNNTLEYASWTRSGERTVFVKGSIIKSAGEGVEF